MGRGCWCCFGGKLGEIREALLELVFWFFLSGHLKCFVRRSWLSGAELGTALHLEVRCAWQGRREVQIAPVVEAGPGSEQGRAVA